MSPVRHTVFFLVYGFLGVGAGIVLPELWPELVGRSPLLCGLWVVLAGGLLHEVVARRTRDEAIRERINNIGQGCRVLRDDINWGRNELDALRVAIKAAGQGGPSTPDDTQRVDEVVAEVKVLQSLIERLYSSRGGAEPPAQATDDDSPTIAPVPDVDVPIATAEDRPEEAPAISVPDRSHEAEPPPLLPVPNPLSEQEILGIAREALRDDRIDLFLQPIVKLPQRKRRFYECFSRLRTAEGYCVLPEQYIALAERAGLVTAIDNMLLFRCVQLVRKVQRQRERVDFFCNVSRRSWHDEEFFTDFVEFLKSNPSLSEHLIFEIPQVDFEAWDESEFHRLERLGQLGCRFSLDQLRRLDVDPGALADRGIRFAKAEAELFLRAARQQPGLIQDWRVEGVTLIVEKIEDEATLTELLEFGIDYAQGYLFSEPRLARPAA